MASFFFQESEWTAKVIISDNEPANGWYHVYATIDGSTEAFAIAGAEQIQNLLSKGRKSLIRVPPEVYSETDFDTKTTRHRAFVRFSFSLENGEWTQMPEAIAPLKFVSLGELNG